MEIEVTEEEIIVDRRHGGQTGFQKDYDSDCYGINRAPRLCQNTSIMEIVFDRCILEVLADDGMTPLPSAFFLYTPMKRYVSQEKSARTLPNSIITIIRIAYPKARYCSPSRAFGR